MSKSPAELLRELEDDLPEVDVERDLAERDRAREQAEQNVPTKGGSATAGLPNTLPVDNTIMRGLGPEGPNHVIFLREEVKRDRKTGDIVMETDEDGCETPVIVTKKIKAKISSYPIGILMDATEYLSCLHDDIRRMALVWSFQKGEGELTPEKAAEVLEGIYPKTMKHPDTGEEVQIRPDFTPELVENQVNNAISSMTQDHIDAMKGAIALAFERFAPHIDEDFLDESDVPELTRILGKIFFLNGPMRERFLT